MKENTLQITCPECGHQFSPERVIEGHLRTHLEKEYSEKMITNSKLIEEKAKASAHAEFVAKVSLLEKETNDKTQKINELQQRALTFSQKEKDLKEKEASLDLEMKQRLLVEEERIRKDAEKLAMAKAEVAFGQKESDLKRQQESLELAVRKSALEQVEKVREEEKTKAC